MDGRHLLVVVLGILTAVSGCTYPIAGLRNSPAPEGDKKEMIHQASTYVAFGDFRGSAGFAPEMPVPQQMQYREDARKSYLKAIEVDPKYVPAYLALARLQQRCDDPAGAVVTYQKALSLSAQDPGLWYELAMCQCRQKSWADGIASLNKALELSPGDRGYLMTLGYTLGRAGKLGESLAVLTRVQGEPRAVYDLARLLRHMNQIDLARQYTAAALQRDPNLPGLQQFAAELDGRSSPSPTSVAHQPPGTAPQGQVRPGGPSAPGPMVQQATNVTTREGSGQEYVPVQATMAVYATPLVTSNQGGTARPIRMPPLPVVSVRQAGP
jgi:tetratricopeptide (TPR) repeat protein